MIGGMPKMRGGGGGGTSGGTNTVDDSGGSSGGSYSVTSSPDPDPDPVSRPPGLGNEIEDSDGDGSADIVDGSPKDSSTTEATVTTMEDPFQSGKTGSEVLAEAGDPAAVVTGDPHADSLEDKIAQDGLSATVGQFKNMAWDGDDGATPTFDNVPNTEAGAEAIADAGSSFVEAARNVAESNAESGASGVIPDNVPAPELPSGIGSGGMSGTVIALLVGAIALLVALVGGS